MKTAALAAIAIAINTTLFTGCSASSVLNTGGDTKCKDFISHDEKKQSDEVSKMLKDKSGVDPSPLQTTSTRLSATTYCQTVGQGDATISQAPHG